ncbi:MAG: Cytosol aminopeptidase PepA [Ktedonobacterales bacterium]|jgi:leucyl aminopeptidase|nr:MAG: Cytosol aminopeptidase PepA [Ktedonobacterales bacterium]
MEVGVSTRDVQQFDGDAVAVGVFSDDAEVQGPAATLDKAMAGVISQLRASGEITGTAGEVTLIHTLGKIEPERVAILGLGPRKRFTADRVRRAAAIASRALRKAGAKRVGLALAWAESGVNLAQAARAAAEGALLGLYAFDVYKAKKNGGNGGNEGACKEIEALTILGRGREPALRSAVERGRILAEATNFARDLGNEPPNVLSPEELANRARRMAEETGLECEIFGQKEMEKQGMGALLGVAQGSEREPRFIILRWRGGRKGEPGPAFVGKGITFDTGGISIKPAEGMQAMKMDMCGGAAVIGAMRAIALLKPAINVTGIVPTTENMPGGNAYRPGDILRASNGKTIEIVNTDAEGRLILADALSYAVKHQHTPIVDAATLTGACVIALGHVRAGLYSNDETLQRAIMAASETAGEKYWPMPMDEEYEAQIASEVADVKQTGGRPAGSITAAKVLENFVAETPWAHMDIAGVNDSEKRDAASDPGATGFAVRTFAELAMQLADRNGTSAR